MKLELNHLAPYLPYGLKGVCTEESQGIETVIGILSSPSYVEVRTNVDDCDITLFKPILRPLSDLTKDEHFDMYMDLCEELGLTRCEHLLLALKDKLYYAFDISKLEMLEEFMYKNHFDWKYNLIDKNLAIDINTIKP